MENWKDAIGYEGLYKVSDLGRVMSIKRKKEKIMSFSIQPRGYKYVCLTKDKKEKSVQVHRLIAFAFLGTPKRPLQVNHKDGNPSNNNLSNLEWVTASQNTRHAWRTGLVKKPFGRTVLNHPNNKL